MAIYRAVAVVLAIAATSVAVDILANDRSLRWSGRLQAAGTDIRYDFAGVSVKFGVTGVSSIDVVLSDLYKNKYLVIVDDVIVKIIETVTSSKKTYSVVAGLTSSRHSIELYKDTEVGEGTHAIASFVFSEAQRSVCSYVWA